MNPEYRYGKTRKNISKTIKSKINDFAGTIVDPVVKSIILKDSIVTGGCIASMLLGEKVNDFDIYFSNYDSAAKVAEYFIKQWNAENSDSIELKYNYNGEKRLKIHIQSSGIASVDDQVQIEEDVETCCDKVSEPENVKPYSPIFLSANAITLSNKIQLITRFHGDAAEIHKNFDFTHATCYYIAKDSKLVLSAEAMESILARTLVYSGSLYPIASIFRMKKFMNRGWKISAGTMLKIMWQINELDLTDFNILEEQLTGVDQSYMISLVSALQSVKPETINSTYVSEIIDRIFGC